MLRPAVLLILFTPLLSLAQKPDRRVVKALQADIEFLASDALEGRMTGSAGAAKAADYLTARYEKLKIPAFGAAYRHSYNYVYGLEAGESRIVLGGQSNLMGGDAFPLPFSANGEVSGDVLIEVQEQGAIWMLPIYGSPEEARDNEYNWQEFAWKQSQQAVRDGAAGIVFYDPYGGTRPPFFDAHCSYERVKIPVAFVGYKQWKELSSAEATMVSVTLDIHVSKPDRKADNVLAWIDNKAEKTIVIGADYDHIGYGAMIMSHAPDAGQHIFNGANDNASGTAAVLQLAEWLKKSRLRNYNYVFAHFSGKILGQLGAKAFCEEAGIDAAHVAGMIDLHMLGAMSDSAQQLMLNAAEGFPLRSEIPGLLQKAGLREMPYQPRGGGSDAAVFSQHAIPALTVSVRPHAGSIRDDHAAQINYAGEARILAFVQTLLKRIDAAGHKVTR